MCGPQGQESYPALKDVETVAYRVVLTLGRQLERPVSTLHAVLLMAATSTHTAEVLQLFCAVFKMKRILLKRIIHRYGAQAAYPADEFLLNINPFLRLLFCLYFAAKACS